MCDQETAHSSADVEVDPPFDYRAKKQRVIYFAVCYSLIHGIVICFLPQEDSALDLLVGFPFLICGILWCYTDAAERGSRIGVITRLLLIFVFVVGLPLYLFQSRGVGAFKSLGLVFALVAAMSACMVTSAFATVYLGQITGLWNPVLR